MKKHRFVIEFISTEDMNSEQMCRFAELLHQMAIEGDVETGTTTYCKVSFNDPETIDSPQAIQEFVSDAGYDEETAKEAAELLKECQGGI